MYEFLDADGERVTVRSTRTLEMLLTQGRITGATRFRRAGEDEFGAAGSHPELQGIAVQLGIALVPPSKPVSTKPRPSAPSPAATLAAPERPAPAPPAPPPPAMVVPATPVPAPADEPSPWTPVVGVPARPAPTSPTLMAQLDVTHAGFARFGVVFGLLVCSAIAGLVAAGLTPDRSIAWLLMFLGGAGAAWGAGRVFRRKHVFAWTRDGVALAAFGAGLLLVGGALGGAYAGTVLFLFTKGAGPGR